MSTSATVTIMKKDIEYVKVYVHWDGYIDGLGHDLANWLKRKRIGNGLSFDSDENFCNGVGCLAAQFIRDIKEEPGGVYIEPLTESNEWFDYNYKVIIDYNGNGTQQCADITTIEIRNFDKSEPAFVGTVDELLNTTDDEVYGDD